MHPRVWFSGLDALLGDSPRPARFPGLVGLILAVGRSHGENTLCPDCSTRGSSSDLLTMSLEQICAMGCMRCCCLCVRVCVRAYVCVCVCVNSHISSDFPRGRREDATRLGQHAQTHRGRGGPECDSAAVWSSCGEGEGPQPPPRGGGPPAYPPPQRGGPQPPWRGL